MCEEQPATALCVECCKCYCDNCCIAIHGLVKKEHKTEVIPKGVRVDARCPLHKDVPLDLFCVDDIELCCGTCGLLGPHMGHKIVKISEVSEDNEVFSAAKVRKRFEGVLKCDDDLEKKIATANRKRSEGECECKGEGFAVLQRGT